MVNTHAHFDHTFGNQVFGPGSDTDAAIHGHAGIARHFERYEAPQPPAHTDTDLVLFLPRERVWIVGLADEMRPTDVVIPGHGRAVDRAFVARQADELRTIADRFRRAHRAGLDAAAGLAAHED